MNISKFVEFSNALAGTGLTDRQIAARISDAIATQSLDPEIGSVGLTLLSVLSSSRYGDDITQYLQDFISMDASGAFTDGGCSFIGPADGVMNYISLKLDDNVLTLNGVEVAHLVDNKWISEYTDTAFTLPGGTKIDDILIGRIASSSGQAYSLSELMNQAAQLDWSKSQTPGIFSDLISDFTAINADLASSLRACAGGGLMVLNGFMTSLYNNLSSALTAARDDDHFGFVTTSVHVNDFAWGMVASTVGSVLAAIGLAITAVSRVIGAIVAAIGAITNFIAGLVANVSQSIGGTKYTVSTATPNPAFNFVLRRYNIMAPALAQFILARGSSYAIITSPEVPCDLYMRVVDADSENPSTIYIEEIPSANFDLISTSIVDGSALDYGQGGFATDSTSSIFFIRCRPNGVYTNTIGVDSSFSEENIPNIIAGAWSPIDISKYGVVRQVTGNDNDYWHARLLSSLFLYTMCYCRTILTALQTKAGTGLACLAPDFYNPQSEQVNGYKTGILQEMFFFYGSAIVAAFYNGKLNTDDHTYVYFKSADIDHDLLLVSEHFNGLAWDVDTQNVGTAVINYVLVPQNYDWSTSLTINTLASEAEDIVEEIMYQYSRNNSFPSWYHEAAYCCATDTPSVSLPATTFSAFIQGLLIDALIVLGAALVVAGTVVAKFKIRNYLARKQANAEAKWYGYQDAINDTSLTQEQRDEAWKDYKRARLSYNIPALLTGATVMTPSSSVDGTNTSDAPAYSIGTIIKLIQG